MSDATPKPDPSRTSHPWHHRLIGILFAGVVGTLRNLPAPLAYGLGAMCTPFLVGVAVCTRADANGRRRGFYWNTEIVFRGSLVGRRRRRLLWSWARHMARLGIDICRMPLITQSTVDTHCDVTEMERLKSCFDQGRGLIVVSGHMGVFEHCGHLIALSGIPLTTIFRESPIPPITDVLNHYRSRGGQKLQEREGAVRSILRLLNAKEAVGIMADVSSKESEIFAPFLGTSAATNNTAGVLHRKTGAPIVVATAARIGSRFRFHVWDVIDHERTENRDADLQVIADRINEALCESIYQYPAQWFWDSRRFRNRPEGEARDDRDMPPQLSGGQLTKMGDRI